MSNGLVRFITDPYQRFYMLSGKGFYNHLSDEAFIKRRFRMAMGYELDLDHPRTFNEKLQWLKIHNKNPEYVTMVDKYRAKEYIANCIGEEYIIPTLGLWSDYNSIDLNRLPDRFVLKCTHDSGGLIICRDKESFDDHAAKRILEKSLKNNYYWRNREWPYRDVPHRIIGEQYICDDDTKPVGEQELTDYKLYCFNGYVDCLMICYDRRSLDTKYYFFDRDWKLKRINKRGKEAPEGFSLPRPKCLEEMFQVAEVLSRGMPFVRIDLYQSNDKVRFGEMTFFPQSGLDPNYLPETDLYFGDLIDLSLAYDCLKTDR